MGSIIRNKKKEEKTTPKNKSVRELCKEANKQIVENAPALAEALCKRVLKDGSPNAMEKLLQLAERMKFGSDGEEETEAAESSFHRNLLDLWESEPEWTGETDEEAAEAASINHELETWQSAWAAEPESKETAAHDAAQDDTAQNGAAQNELGIRAAEPARQEIEEPDPQGTRSATEKPAGVVTPSGFVVYQGAAAHAPTETKAVDNSR